MTQNFFLVTSLTLACFLSGSSLRLPRDRVETSLRYVGVCETRVVVMTPGNSRKFWSLGYVYLKEPYPADCVLKYRFETRFKRKDTYVKFGFRVTGTFSGPDIAYSSCHNTDYVFLDDSSRNSAIFCGPDARIEYVTGSSSFEFNFVSQKNSPRGLGFFVVIESVRLCGGLLSAQEDGPTGYISSPLHSEDYPANTGCSWLFTAKGTTTIKLNCHSFWLEDSTTSPDGTTRCIDKLSVSYEVGHSKATEYCDTDLQHHTIWSKGPYLLLNFRSNSVNQYTGFNCSYEFVRYGK
ncbi:cubilin-like [Penaeus vannamei]|uniref:cubilin-like n=1 Tax=Penaeus vannamei TaxID=6689 RepID=UPI00387F8A55